VRKPSFIKDKTLYAAVMKVCEETLVSGRFEDELLRWAAVFRVDTYALRKHAEEWMPFFRASAYPQRAWTGGEENRLRQDFFRQMDVLDLSEKYRRSPASIAAKLVRLGCVKSRDDVPGYRAYKKKRRVP